MSIAQRSVAGEGEVHPFADETGNVSVRSPAGEDRDAAALHAFATDATNLPWLVFRAAFRAAHVDGLPARARALLAALARTVDAARPYGAIYARRELLHDRSLLSRRTLYRALDDLETAGLIRRAGQLRIASEGYEGQFGRTYLHLTSRAAILLGFVEPTVSAQDDPTPPGAIHPVNEPSPAHISAAAPANPGSPTTPEVREPAIVAQSPVMAADSTGPVEVPGHSSFGPPCATVALRADNRDLLPGSSQKRQPGQLPADLERLRALGFSKFLIFGLMRDARQHGKRLSDVVEATWTHLKQANRPICYLRSLLHSPVDFGYQLRAKHTEATARRDAEAEREEATRFAIEAAGQTYVDDSGMRRIDVDGDGQGATVRAVHENVPRREAGDWTLRLLRAVRSDRLRLATSADLEAFAQASRRRQVPAPSEAASPRQLTESVSVHLAGLRALVGGSARAVRSGTAAFGPVAHAAATSAPATSR